MHHRLAKCIYRVVQGVRNERLLPALKYLEATQWYPTEDIKELQFRLLIELVEHAYASVPYYRKKFDDVGFYPAALNSLDDLAKIPVLTKADLHTRHHELIASDKKYTYSVDSTSGSSGPATSVYTDRNASAFERAAVFRSWRWYGMDFGMRTVRFWGTQLDKRRIAVDRVRDLVLNRRTFATNDINKRRLFTYYEKIVKFRPQIIHGFTSAIYEFCVFLEDHDLDISEQFVGLVIATGEVLHNFQKEKIEKVLKARVMNEYGSAEFGPITYSCPSGGHHVMAEYLIVEVANNEGCKVEWNTGEVIVTHLRNKVMPLIRYKLGDYASTGENNCECGRGLPMIRNIQGRVIDFIRTPDGRVVHGISFDYLPKYFDGQIKQFQVVQNEMDCIKVALIKDTMFSNDTLAELEKKLRLLVGDEIRIKFVLYGDYLPREGTGKQRMVIGM